MALPTETPLQISEYLIIPLLLLPLPSFPTCATHYLYLAKHQPKVPSITTSRSLFLVNVPFDATDANLKRLFSTQLDLPSGRIENVYFEGEKVATQDRNTHPSLNSTEAKRGKKRKRPLKDARREEIEGAELPSTWDQELTGIGGTAVVVFVDQASLETVIRAVKKIRRDRKELTWEEGMRDDMPALGPARYISHQKLQFPDKTELLESVNTFMNAFAAQEAEQVKKLAKQRREPDKDGFMTVTKGGRNGPAWHEATQEQAERQKEKHKGYEDFYRFQLREKQKAQAEELLRKFEEDKQRVKRIKKRNSGRKST